MGSASPEPRAVTIKRLEGEVDGRVKNRFARLIVLDQDTHVYGARTKRVRCSENANDERTGHLARAHHSTVSAGGDRGEQQGCHQREVIQSVVNSSASCIRARLQPCRKGSPKVSFFQEVVRTDCSTAEAVP